MWRSLLPLYVAALGISVLVPVAACLLMRRPLRDLLDRILRLPAATTFYLRTLWLVVGLASLAAVLNTNLVDKVHGTVMEKVWEIEMVAREVVEQVGGFTLIFVALVTVLVSTLRFRGSAHDE